MKKISVFILCIVLICTIVIPCSAAPEATLDDSIPSAILIEAESGKVLFEKDADLELAPASVTKVMTMLLIMEAIDSGALNMDDMVTASANAASMGGSQVYLKEGEQFSVSDMLKSITMASANDACVAMAEHICGSVESFVARMNERASELNMQHTNFENTNGLDDTTESHYTSARDISIMSRELILNHPKILEFTSVWMDSVRGGEFGLTNTNRLVRFYNGANGLKTGSTSKAGFCISASALRDGMQLICVIMKAPTRDTRNEAAKRLLDYGFANFETLSFDAETLTGQKIKGADKETADFYTEPYTTLIAKGRSGDVVREIILNENISAPLSKDDKVGIVRYSLDGEVLCEGEVKVSQDINEITYFGIITKILRGFLCI